MKRLFDFCWAFIGLLLLSPIFLAVSILIWVDDRGPVFFRQTRIGRFGEPFRMWKFRTMIPDAEKRGASITVGRDPRITRVGHWLRRTKIDELPQLINVLVGEMSLVGPRPEVKRYVDLYTPEQARVLELKPGITDLASLKYRNENELLDSVEDSETFYITQIMPDKIRINIEYSLGSCVWSDFCVIVTTVFGYGRS